MSDRRLSSESLVTETDALRRASRLRREPYVLLFPLAVALSWVGVTHWLLHAIGWMADYRPRFHATVQTQGFLTCLAVGFLMTMIPRRTGTSPPAAWQVLVGALGPILVAASAWERNWQMAQLFWLVTALTTTTFVVTRFVAADAKRRPPNGFVWIPAAFAMGVAGSALVWIAAELGDRPIWEQLGSRLVQQGLFAGLVLGVGSLALPLMTRGVAPPDGGVSAADRRARGAHLVAAILLAVSFWLEVAVSLRAGMLLRGLVILVVLVVGAQIWRPPERDGWNARVILISAWLLPTGYLLAAAFPQIARAGLHVSLIGGFALLGLSVAAQVILGHGGYREVLFGRPTPLLWVVVLIATATVCRVLMELVPADSLRWMGSASVLFLAATLLWLRLVAPGLLAPRSDRP